MKLYISFCLVFILGTLQAQKISRDNPTYLEANNDLIEYVVKWKNDSFNQLYYFNEEIPATAQLMPLKFNKRLKVQKLGQINSLNLFYLDTNRNSEGAHYRIYANPEMFDSLNYINLASEGKGTYFIGKFTSNLIEKKVDLKSLIRTILSIGMIGTYHHLYAEMVELKENDSEKWYELKFDVVWHMCTNKCVHPKYKFSVRIDKENWMIYVVK